MAVKLRLKRMGKKKQPFYRIVAIDSRTSRDGKYIEKVGHYDPMRNPAEIQVNEEKALYWLKQGAIPSDTVKSLLSTEGILLKFDLMKKGFEQDKIDEELKKWELLQLEQKKRKEAEEIQKRSSISEEKEEAKTGEDHSGEETENTETMPE
ncbi:30S ribosomal protein S16 [candidate division KSB1 bacterium]|nr:30S ribosomal protein S16 [candidate division KSB1 bacterium]